MKTYKELVEACWKNYKQIGMKTKGKKLVPNCVPVNEELEILEENRLDFIKNNTKELSTEHDSTAEHKDKDKIIDHLSDKADPTKNKAHTGWLVKQYKNGSIRQEDHPALKDSLSDFEKYKGKLEKKDINQYKDIGEIRSAVNPHIGTPATKKEEADEGHEEIHSEPGLKVYHVKSNKASQDIYGGGSKLGGTHTDWCTAYRSNGNQYDHYTSNGHKLVTFHKENDPKSPYQLHLTDNHIHHQFQDKTNAQGSLDDMIKEHPGIKNIPLLKKSSSIRFHTDEDMKNKVDELHNKENKSDEDHNYIGHALGLISDHKFLDKHLENTSSHTNPHLTDEQQDKISNNQKSHHISSNNNLKPDLIDKHSTSPYDRNLTRTTKGNLLHYIDKEKNKISHYAAEQLNSHPKADKEVVNKVYDKALPETRRKMLSHKDLDHKHVEENMHGPFNMGRLAKNKGLSPEHYKKIHNYAVEHQLTHIHENLSSNSLVPKEIHKHISELYEDMPEHKDIVKNSTKHMKAK